MTVSRLHSIAAGAFVTGAILAAAIGDGPSLPDARITPGAIATTSAQEVCMTDGRSGSAYSRLHRHTTYETRLTVLRAYGVSLRSADDFELDHLVPLCLGGADRPANLWPEAWGEARQKDRLEARMCRKVCEGAMRLVDAQHWFLGNAWAKDIR